MNKVNNIIRFAIIGAGRIGQRHMNEIRANNQCLLVAIIDTNIPDDGRFGTVLPLFSSLEQYFKSGPECDVVIIASPNGMHAEHAMECISRGLHVVIEKPMALRSEDVKKIKDRSIQQGTLVFGVMQNRYSPVTAWLKDTVSKNILGEIYLVQICCYWNRDERYYTKGSWHGSKLMDGGTLFTQFSHFIDLIYWIFGDIENIDSRIYDFNHGELTEFEDCGVVSFDLVKGGIGNLNFSTALWDQNMDSDITVIGQHGSIKISGQYMDTLAYCHIKDFGPPTGITGKVTSDPGKSNHKFVIQNVVDVLLNKSLADNNLEDSFKVIEMIERIYAANRHEIIK